MAAPDDAVLPPNQSLYGYIFKCNNFTLPTCLDRMTFGLSEPYRHSVKTITPGILLFLYNMQTGRLHGIYEAADSGGYNMEPTLCPDPRNPGRSLYPAQVRARIFKACEPLTPEITRNVLQNLRLPRKRFRLVLSRSEVNLLLSAMLGDALLANQV